MGRLFQKIRLAIGTGRGRVVCDITESYPDWIRDYPMAKPVRGKWKVLTGDP